MMRMALFLYCVCVCCVVCSHRSPAAVVSVTPGATRTERSATVASPGRTREGSLAPPFDTSDGGEGGSSLWKAGHRRTASRKNTVNLRSSSPVVASAAAQVRTEVHRRINLHRHTHAAR